MHYYKNDVKINWDNIFLARFFASLSTIPLIISEIETVGFRTEEFLLS